jgi:hypothetical protein
MGSLSIIRMVFTPATVTSELTSELMGRLTPKTVVEPQFHRTTPKLVVDPLFAWL